MRTRTVLALVAVLVILGGLLALGLAMGSGSGLTERWISDTARDNEVNHHPLAVGPNGETVVAPVTALPSPDDPPGPNACSLVSLDEANGSVRWRDGVAPDRCMTHALTEPAIGDLDGDGGLEVAVSTTQSAVHVLDAADGEESFRVDQPTYGYGPPRIVDISPAPGRAVLASDIAGNVVLVHANGSVAWRHSLGETLNATATVWDGPAVADLDGDDGTEIAIAAREAPVVLEANGTVEWVGETDATYLVTAQVDDSAAGRTLFTADGGVVRSIDGRTRAQDWQRTFDQVARIQTATDVDGDGTVELLVGLADGTAVALDGESGETEWTTTVTTAENAVLAAPIVANVGGNEGGQDRAVVTAARDGTVAVLDPTTGAERAAYQRDVPIWTYPAAADLDDDGTDELVVRYGDGRVVALALDW